MQAIVRDVPADKLAVALRGADQKVKDKFTGNMSQRAAEIMLEDMEARGRCAWPRSKPRRRKSSPWCADGRQR
jgi:flagellar motor switch protein FliG